MSYDSSKIFKSVKDSDNARAKLMSQNMIQEIEKIVDSKNSTLLHVAANNNNIDMIQYYLNAYKKLIKLKPLQYTSETLAKWIGTVDGQGFSCLHYAVFTQNYKMTLLLEQNGADISQTNSQGLTVMHIAAQGDSPLLLYHFLEKGLKIDAQDIKGSSPLHWACYSGMENSSNALIAWGSDLNKQERSFGMTPLHLAVMSGNGHIVKKLLLKGCNRNIKAENGKLPLDIATENEYNNIIDMITDKQGISELIGIKTPFRKLKKHTFPFYLLLFFYFSGYLLNMSICLKNTLQKQFEMSITFLVFGFIVTILFILCKYSNPGVLKSKTTDYHSMHDMLLKHKASQICFECKIVKPARSKHCEECNSCICVFDHHCPWVANCIGAYNYPIFFSFIISLLIFIVYTIVFEIINLSEGTWDKQHPLITIQRILQIYTLIISMVFIFPLLFLIIVQIRNMMENKTTFERYSFKRSLNKDKVSRQSQARRSSNFNKLSQQLQSPKEKQELSSGTSSMQIEYKVEYSQKNCWKNCIQMCIGNRKNEKYQLLK